MKKKGTRCLHQDTKSLITPSLHLCFALTYCLFVCYECISQSKQHNILTSNCLHENVCCGLGRNKDVGMGLWVTLCLGVGILFLSFSWSDSPTSPFIWFFHLFHSFFILGQTYAGQDIDFTHAHAQADNTPFYARVHAHVYGIVQCLPVKSPTIYRRNLRREKNDRLVSVHTSIDYGNVWWKNQCRGLFR